MVRWSRRARDDLKAIHDRIATDSPITAKSVVRQIWSQADTLTSVSLRGRAVPEVNDASLREASLGLASYLSGPERTEVFIIAVIHKRRSPRPDDLGL
jgi:toxin ParE1/3/4